MLGSDVKAEPATYYLLFDGSCQPKGSGCSSIGLFVDREGLANEMFKISSPLVTGTTSNESEYFGLIRGLRMLLRTIGVSQSHKVPLVVISDSELVLNQIQGVYQCRNTHLRLLCTTARGLLESFPRVCYKHVNRDMNEEADVLAKESVNKQQDRNALAEFYPNLAFAFEASVQDKTVVVTNNFWANTPEKLSFIDAAFLLKCFGESALRHMKDPYPLTILRGRESMNILGIFADDITLRFNLNSGGTSKPVVLTNVLVVHRFAVPLHVSLSEWKPELLKDIEQVTIGEKDPKIFGSKYSTHPFWNSKVVYLSSAIIP
eukprot:Nk52_evm92s1444 gene=Nk52_evmTU92s1444